MESPGGLKVAILVDDGFEELARPRNALDRAGAETRIVSTNGDPVRSWNPTDCGAYFPIDVALSGAKTQDFDALVLLPGGVMNPDRLRIQPAEVDFVTAFFEAGKPVAAICQGPWTIIEAGEARGQRIASWPSLKTDLRNAGAEWVGQEEVVDETSFRAESPTTFPRSPGR